jgi:hypothetical protein
MRKILPLAIVLFLFCPHAYSQIEGVQVRTSSDETRIGRIFSGTEKQLEIVKKTGEEETFYQITYKDFRYPRIYSTQFIRISNEETLQDLRRIIFEMFDSSERKMEVSFEIEGQTAMLSKDRLIGYTGVTLLVYEKGWTGNFSRRNWERAFENLP